MKPETRQAIEEAREAYDENMGFIRCIKSDPRNIIHDAYEHALTLAIAEIEEQEETCKYRLDQMVEMQNEIVELKAENNRLTNLLKNAKIDYRK